MLYAYVHVKVELNDSSNVGIRLPNTCSSSYWGLHIWNFSEPDKQEYKIVLEEDNCLIFVDSFWRLPLHTHKRYAATKTTWRRLLGHGGVWALYIAVFMFSLLHKLMSGCWRQGSRCLRHLADTLNRQHQAFAHSDWHLVSREGVSSYGTNSMRHIVYSTTLIPYLLDWFVNHKVGWINKFNIDAGNGNYCNCQWGFPATSKAQLAGCSC